jgi:hypothetical protein
MSQRRLRPSQGGSFHKPIGPSADLVSQIRSTPPDLEARLDSRAPEFKGNLAGWEAQRREVNAVIEARRQTDGTWEPTDTDVEALKKAFIEAEWPDLDLTGIPPAVTKLKDKPATPNPDRFNPVYDDLTRGAVAEDWIPDPRAGSGRSFKLADMKLDPEIEFHLAYKEKDLTFISMSEIEPSRLEVGNLFTYKRRSSKDFIQHPGGVLWEAQPLYMGAGLDSPSSNCMAFTPEGHVSHVAGKPYTPFTGPFMFRGWAEDRVVLTPELPAPNPKADPEREPWALAAMLGVTE